MADLMVPGDPCGACNPAADFDGGWSGFSGRFADVDAFRKAVEAATVPMCFTDPRLPDDPIIFANRAFEELTGYNLAEIIGRNCRFLQGPETDGTALQRVRAALAAGRPARVEMLNYRKDGSSFWNALFLAAIHDGDGVRYHFAVQLDVTAHILANRALTRQKEEIEAEVRRRTRDLERALEEKTLLLREVDHRVKNNLTMIGSLIRMQARAIGDPRLSERLAGMLRRVEALSTVHRRLHGSEDILRVDLPALIADVAADVIGASGRTDIDIETDFEPMTVPSASAATLGLIFNELITNSVKHAFDAGRSGTIRLSTRRDGTEAVALISDDGPGMANAAERDRPHTGGFGGALVQRLAKNAGVSLKRLSALPGCHYELRLDTAA